MHRFPAAIQSAVVGKFVVAPPMEQDPIYLRLLADIVKAVRLSRVRQRLLEAPDFESVREILAASVARE